MGTLDNSTINYQGFTSVYPLQISGTTDPEKAFYVINNNPTPISQINVLSVQKGTITSYLNLYLQINEAPVCPSGTYGEWDEIVPASLLGGQTQKIVDRICIGLQTLGTKSDVPAVPNIQFSSHFSLLANSKSESLDLSFDKTSATSTTGQVQANWVGSLVTGNAAPSGNQYVAIDNPQTSVWIVKQINDFSDWNNLFTSIQSQYSGTHTYSHDVYGNCYDHAPPNSFTFVGDWNAAYNSFTSCLQSQIQTGVSDVNFKATNLVNGNSVSIGSNPTTFTSYNGQNAFSIPLTSYFITNPVVTLRFSGSFLGVVIPLGKPKITSVTSDPFNSGSTGTIKVFVSNIGNAQGSFYASLNNCPSVSTTSPPNYAVQVGQNQEIDVPVSTTGANQLSESCTVQVTDSNGGGSDSASVNILMKEADQCTPNTQIVQGNSVCPCKNVNGVYKIASGNDCTSCSNGVISDGKGGWLCAQAPTQTPTQTTNPTQTTTPTSCKSDLDCNSNSLCDLNSNSCNQISIGKVGKTDVVITTMGASLNENSNYKDTIAKYQRLLKSRGMSSIYIELDSDRASYLFGSRVSSNDWQSIKSVINRIEYTVKPTYVIILGGPSIVPMPEVSTSLDFGSQNGNPNIIPTDDPYGSLSENNLPTYVISRIPGSNSDDISKYLSNGIQRSYNQNNNILIVGDGLTGPDDAFVRYDTDTVSKSSTGLSCEQSQNCLYSPPNCIGQNCEASTTLKNQISTQGIQFYVCHGSGYSCSDKTGTYDIIDSSNVPTLNAQPIVLTSACFNGMIDRSGTLALQMLEKGTSVYIGNTKEGFSGDSASELGQIFNKFKSGETIGKAFLDMKSSYLTNPNDPYAEGTAHELQLYGDPTLSMSG